MNFYTIDTQTGKFSKKGYRVAGDNATWNLSDGVLTVAGTGDITIDTEAHYRYPLSSTDNSYVYSSSDNSWKPIRDKVMKIVIETGLTSISDNVFSGFGNLTEVNIKPGLKSIGAKAFYNCENLMKITIPDSVVKIGDDFLWSGYYWIGSDTHVVYATIYASDNSYAVQYAKKYNIAYNTGTNSDVDETETEPQTTEASATKKTTTNRPTSVNIRNKKTYKKSKKVTIKDKDGIKTIKLNGKKLKVKSGKKSYSFKLSKYKKYLKNKNKWNQLVITDVKKKKKTIKFKVK